MRKLDFPFKVRDFSLGWGHVVCVDSSGRGYSMGWNLNGECGVGFKGENENCEDSSILEPKRIEALKGENIQSVTCGDYHSFCFTENHLFGFGKNDAKQISFSSGEYILSPFSIPLHTLLSPNEKLVSIACGYKHTIFLTSLGRVLSCGFNSSLQWFLFLFLLSQFFILQPKKWQGQRFFSILWYWLCRFQWIGRGKGGKNSSSECWLWTHEHCLFDQRRFCYHFWRLF